MVAPYKLTRPIVTRGYELDLDNLIPPVQLLRYMEHLRWLTLQEGTVDLQRLFSNGHRMVVVGQALALEREVGFGVELCGTMVVAGVGRSSFTFLQEFFQGQQLVARGTATAVYLDPAGRPTTVPDEFHQAVHPDAHRGPVAPRLSEDPPAGAWSGRIVARPSEQDLLRHVNHAYYLAYCDDLRRTAAEAGAPGLPPARARLRALALDYRDQAVAGDELSGTVWPLSQPGALGVELRRVSGKAGPSPPDRPVCRARLEVKRPSAV